MRALCRIAEFVRRIRMEKRFGKLSRAPLKLLRMEVQGAQAEFDWLARPADEWDESLPYRVREENFSLQALQDAVELREMFFDLLPDISESDFRAFRKSANGELQMILFGRVTREDPGLLRVTSPAMRAKLHGFRFNLQEGVLRQLELEQSRLQLVVSA